jgi:hypothetical protein
MQRRIPASALDVERAPAGDSGFDVGRTLAEHAEGIATLRELGFERCKGLLEIESLSERDSRLAAWGVDEESRALLRTLLDHLSAFDVMTGLGDAVLAPAAPCALVARFEAGSDGRFAISSLVSYFSTDRYAIDYERLTQARRDGIFSEAESNRLPALLAEIESINYRGDTLHKILCGLADAHVQFLRSGREEDLAALTQLNLANSIGVLPSAVCRAVAGRSILTPWGEERTLASLFPGRRARKARAVAAVLRAEPRLSDREVAQRLHERFGYRISRRSAALYRCGMSIPNSYGRTSVANPAACGAVNSQSRMS